MILLTTGLLTLLVFTSAGGDHIKGGGHIKGGDHIKGGGILLSAAHTVPQAIVQEEVVPPLSVKTDHGYGTRIISQKTAEPVVSLKGGHALNLKTAHAPHEVVHHAAQLHHAAVVPVVQIPVVHSVEAADPARVKGLETVVAPTVGKTSVVHVAQEPASVKGLKTLASPLGKTSAIPAALAADQGRVKTVTKGKTVFHDAQIREPVAIPAVKTSPPFIQQQSVKSVRKMISQPNTIITQQKIAPIGMSAIVTEGIESLPRRMESTLIVDEETGIVPMTGAMRPLVAPIRYDSNINPILTRGVIRTAPQAVVAPRPIIVPNPQISAPVVPEPVFSDDILQLNRQLMQKQNEEEIKRALTGMVNTDADIGSITFSADQLGDVSRRLGSDALTPVLLGPQQRRPSQLPPARPGPQQRRPDPANPALPGPQKRRPSQVPPVRPGSQQRRPSQVQPARPESQPRRPDQIIRRIPIAPQPAVIGGGLGMIRGVGVDQSVRYTPSRVSTTGVRGVSRPIIPGQIIGGTPNIQGENIRFMLGNTAGTVRTIPVTGQRIAAPKPQISLQVQPKPQITAPLNLKPGSEEDIIQLNRQLMKKQNEEEIKRTLTGMVNTDSDIGSITFSADQLGDVSRRLGSNVLTPALPDLTQPALPRPQQRRPIQLQPARPGPQQIRPNQRQPARPGPQQRRPDQIQPAFPVPQQRRPDQAQPALPVPQQRRPIQLQPAQPGPQQRRPSQVQPARPESQPRRPDQIRRRIPIAPQPAVFGGGLGMIRGVGVDQSVRYTPSRVLTTGVRGVSRPINPGQIIGGTPNIQGENIRFMLGNTAGTVGTIPFAGQRIVAPKPQISLQIQPKPQIAAPLNLKPGSEEDIIQLNRQLMKKQNEEEIKRALTGMVNTGSDIGSITFSADQLGDVSRHLGSDVLTPALPVPQQRRPDQAQPARPRPQQRRPSQVQPAQPVSQQRRPSQVQPARPESQPRRPDQIIRRIPFAPQPASISGGLGMIRGVGIDQSVRYTPSRVLTAGVRGVSRQIIPGQMIGGTPNIQGENIRFLLGNTAGTVGTIPVAGQGIQVQPKSQIAAPLNLKHQSEEDIIQLNRQLMQKQNEEEIKRALTGMVNTDSDIGSITFSANQLGDVSRRLGSDVLTPALPGAEQRRPDQAQPALPRPQQRRPSQLQPARPGPQQIRPNQRQPAQPGPQQRRPDQIQPALPIPQQRRPDQAQPALPGRQQRRPIQLQPAQPGSQQRRPSQVQPARPESQPRRPDQIRRRIPIAPQPAVFGGGLGMIRGVGVDQSVRYTPSRVLTTGVRGVSRPINPGQIIGGTPNIQGENIRFMLGNTAGTVGTIPFAGQRIVAPKPQISLQIQPKPQIAAPLNLKPGSEEDIIQLNRQLMKKQNEEEIKRALTGMVNTGSDIGSITFSADQLGDVSRHLGSDVLTPALPVPQQRRPDQAQPARPRPQQRRPSQVQPAQPVSQQRRPSQVQPARPESQPRRPDQIIRRIPFAPQPASISGGLGMIRGVGIDQSVRYTPSRVLTAGVRGVSRQIIPGQMIGGTPNIQGENIRFLLGNTAGTVGTIPVAGQGIQVQPKSQIAAPLNLKHQSEEDIIQLNRQLMQKQNEEEIKRALTGMVNTDSDIGSITFSANQLGDVSRRLGSDVLTPALPGAEQRRPDQAQPALPRPQQRRPSQLQPARPGPQQIRPNQRQPAQPGPQQRRPDQIQPALPIPQQRRPDQAQPALPGRQQRRPIQLQPAQPGSQQRRPSQVQPARPESQPRRPDQIIRRIPIAPQPAVIGGGLGMIRGVGVDQSVRYTPSRVLTTGVRGVSRPIIPGQIIGGTPNIQGENIRFMLGNTAGTVGTIPVAGQRIAAPKPQISLQVQPKPLAAPLNLKPQSEEDIIQLNRQLMQKQNEEEIKRALTGMVNTDSDIGSITFSADQLGDVSRRLGSDVLTPALPGAEQRRPDQAQPALSRQQQRRPNQLQPARPGPQQIRPNQRQPARPGPQQRRPDQIQPALPVPQQRRPGQANPSLPLPQQRRPSQVQPARPGSPQRRPDQIRRRIPIAPQPAVIGGGLGMIRGVDQSVRYTPSRVLTTGVRGVSRPIIPGQIIGGTPNIQGENIRFMLGNTAGTVGTIPVVGQGIQVQPKPQISAPLNLKPGSEEDIIQLNRQLMKKQNEEEIKRALTGMVNNDSDIGSITFSADQLGDVSRRLGSDVLTPALPGAEQRRPDQVQPALPRPQQRRPSQVQPARPLPQQRIPNQRQPAPPGPQQRRPDQVRRVTPAAVGQRIPLAPQPALTAPVLPNIPRLPKQEFGEDIIQLNKQLMQKQNEEEIKRALAGIVGADTDIGSISLTETDLADVSRRLGGDSLAPVIPAPQQRRPDQLRPAIPTPQQRRPAQVRPFLPAPQQRRPAQVRPAIPAPQQRRPDQVLPAIPAPQQRRPDQVLPAIPAPQQRRPDQVQPAIPAPQQRKPEQIRRVKPATTGQRIPVIPKPGLIGTNSGAINNLNQIVRYNTIGSVPGSQRRIISGQVIPTTPVILGGNVVPGLGNALGPVGAVRYSVPKPMISPQIIPRPEISAAVLPKPDLDEGIIHFNRELMLKINEEELRQALSGVLKPHSDINKLSLTADEFDEISRQLSYTPQVIPVPTLTRISSDSARQRFGAGIRTVASDGLIPGNVLITPGSQILDAQRSADFGKRQIQTQVINEVQEKIRQDQIEPPVELQQRIEPTIPAINVIGNRFSQIKEPIVKFSPVEPSANTPVIKTVQSNLDSGDSQMQVKVDDVIEQTQLKRVVHPVQSRLSLESLSQKYLQEKIPIDVPSYVPLPSFMAPFNYRVPHLRTPIVQQQEKLDQILV